MHRRAFVCLSILLVVGCKGSAPAEREPAAAAATAKQAPASAQAAQPAPVIAAAKVGDPAPDFELADLDGNKVKLSSFRGKTVVLEWFNPECPFVKKSHTKGSLVDTALRHMKRGVTWLAINSGGPGKQGHGVDKNREGAKQFGMTHPVLLDETGTVGKAYGAKRTPTMLVIDAKGTLVYRGAIDNSPDAEGESPDGGKLVNYVDAALADVAAGRPVATAETEAYGCSVKYPN
jgi:peroxiredoxin